MEIIECRIEHLQSLRSLAIKTFVHTYSQYNAPEVMAEYLERAFSPDQLRTELTTSGSAFYALRSGDQWIGYIKLNEGEAQTEVRPGKVLEIERIYVDQAFQGKGFGKNLLNKAIDVAREKGKEAIWLGVWEHNPKAIRFYEGQGFAKNGTHIFMIGGEAQTDWVMELAL